MRSFVLFLTFVALVCGFAGLSIAYTQGFSPEYMPFGNMQNYIDAMGDLQSVRSILRFQGKVSDWLLSLFNFSGYDDKEVYEIVLDVLSKVGWIVLAGVPAIVLIGLCYVITLVFYVAFFIRLIFNWNPDQNIVVVPDTPWPMTSSGLVRLLLCLQTSLSHP